MPKLIEGKTYIIEYGGGDLSSTGTDIFRPVVSSTDTAALQAVVALEGGETYSSPISSYGAILFEATNDSTPFTFDPTNGNTIVTLEPVPTSDNFTVTKNTNEVTVHIQDQDQSGKEIRWEFFNSNWNIIETQYTAIGDVTISPSQPGIFDVVTVDTLYYANTDDDKNRIHEPNDITSMTIEFQRKLVDNITTHTHIVTVGDNGGNKFKIDGAFNPILAFVKGNTYIFDQSDVTNSGHQIQISESPSGANTSYATSQ